MPEQVHQQPSRERDVPLGIPESVEGSRQRHSLIHRAVATRAPGQGAQNVLVIPLETIEPGGLVWAPGLALSDLRELSKELDMTHAYGVGSTARLETFERELTDGLEQPVSRLVGSLKIHDDQRFLDQAAQIV